MSQIVVDTDVASYLFNWHSLAQECANPNTVHLSTLIWVAKSRRLVRWRLRGRSL